MRLVIDISRCAPSHNSIDDKYFCILYKCIITIIINIASPFKLNFLAQTLANFFQTSKTMTAKFLREIFYLYDVKFHHTNKNLSLDIMF